MLARKDGSTPVPASRGLGPRAGRVQLDSRRGRIPRAGRIPSRMTTGGVRRSGVLVPWNGPSPARMRLTAPGFQDVGADMACEFPGGHGCREPSGALPGSTDAEVREHSADGLARRPATWLEVGNDSEGPCLDRGSLVCDRLTDVCARKASLELRQVPASLNCCCALTFSTTRTLAPGSTWTVRTDRPCTEGVQNTSRCRPAGTDALRSGVSPSNVPPSR